VTASLELDAVSRHFGSLHAVDEVSFEVAAGARHAVIGPNGAGKSTLFALISGVLAPTSGRVLVDGHDVTRMPEHKRVRRGVGRTFQHSSLFLRETALENVLLAVQRHAGAAWSMLRPLSGRRALLDRAQALLQEVGVGTRAATPVGALSHGERRQVELAVALAAEPRLLLLDEPAAGMSRAETAQMTRLLSTVPAEVTILLVEHDLDLVFELATQVTVLHLGRHLMTGSPSEVRRSAEVQAAYLGAAQRGDAFAAAAAATAPGSRSASGPGS